MTVLPEPPAAPTAGQTTPTDADRDQAERWLAALDDIPTSFRDRTPLPARGTSPPVPQPGRPPMSQKAVDASALMLSGGVATVLVGGTASLFMVATGLADPTVVGIVAAAPIAVAVPIAAVTRLLKRAKQAVPGDTHHHYNAPVTHTTNTTHSTAKGIVVKNTNQQQ